MAGTVQGPNTQGTIEAYTPSAPAVAANLPNIPPEPDFIYFADPSSWDVFKWSDGTEELLPVLKKGKLDPGIGGVSESGDYSLMLVARRRKGQIEIPRTYDPDTDYVKAIKVRNGVLYHERWRSFIKVGASVRERAPDNDGYLTFLRTVAEAYLPEPAPEVLEGRQEIYRTKLVRQVEAAAGNPLKAVNVEKTQEKIDTLEAFKAGEKTIPPKAKKTAKVAKGEAVTNAGE